MERAAGAEVLAAGWRAVRHGGFMADRGPAAQGWHWCALLFILILAIGLRLHRLQAPVLDQMYAKQIYVANKARNIAGPPLAPLRNTLDFLEEDGERIRLTEEVPL